MRRVANLGLKTAYNSKKAVHIFVKKLLALPYLPADHITPAFNKLSTQATSPQLQQLVRYLSNTWLNNNVWSVHQWSIFRQTVRTNNDVEGWHRRFNANASGNKLHFYKLVPALMKEAKSVTMTVRLVEEQAAQRYRRTTYKTSQDRLVTLWDQLEAKTLKTSDFIREPWAPCMLFLCQNQTKSQKKATVTLTD